MNSVPFRLRPAQTPLRLVAASLVATLGSRAAMAAPSPVSAPPSSPPPASSAATSAGPGSPPASHLPATDATSALTRAMAAYEYGDIEEMVAAARLVAEGTVRPVSPSERVQALRLVGIGLYLLDRREGAEAAFYELLRVRPDSRLDPRTTRPDVVSFFEWLKQRHESELRAMRPTRRGPEAGWLVLLPPAGQFANGERGLGLAVGTLEVVSLGTAITSWALFRQWQKPDGTFPGHESDAHALKVVNTVAWATFLATFLFGVAEAALYRPSKAPADETGFAFEPGGVRWRF